MRLIDAMPCACCFTLPSMGRGAPRPSMPATGFGGCLQAAGRTVRVIFHQSRFVAVRSNRAFGARLKDGALSRQFRSESCIDTSPG